MTRCVRIVLAAALPLAAQPKLPVFAKLDTRSAGAGRSRGSADEVRAAHRDPGGFAPCRL
jgi:hypothetical protein